MKSNLKKTIPVVWVVIMMLGALSPASTALGTLAQDSSATTSVPTNVNANISMVMIRSLNTSIQAAINKIMAFNVSKNSTEWQLIKDANQSLKLATQAYTAGNYTAAIKYAQEGLAKIRKALELLTQEYRVRANETLIKVIRFEGEVRALNRTAHVLMNATTQAEEKGTINATTANELKTILQDDIKMLTELATYLGKVINGTETLNVTYVTNTLEKVTKDLAKIRDTLNNSAAEKIQETIKEKVMEQIKILQEEIKKITQAAQEAQEQNLTLMSQELTQIAQNLTQKLTSIEKRILNMTMQINASEIEKLLNMTNQVKILVSTSHEVKCYSRHAFDLRNVMDDLVRLRMTIMKASMAYNELKLMSESMGGNIANEVTNMSKLMKALQGNYSELEKALVAGNPESVRKHLNAINATATQLRDMVNKMMQEKMNGPFASQMKTVLRNMDNELKIIAEQAREKLHSMEDVANHSQTARVVATETELRAAMKQLERIVNFGKMSGALTPAQANKVHEVQTSLEKAITMLKNGNTSDALKIINTSVSVLREIQHEVSMKTGNGGMIVSTEIEVVIEMLHTVQSMIK